MIPGMNNIETIRIDASTICQLRCDGCGFQKSNGRELGYGFLSFENFKAVIDKNPNIKRVELSNYGEIFLNPDLIRIMEYAHKKNVLLEAAMGVNFNTVSDEQIKALVDYKFNFLSFSIDGASQETYSKYRIRGNFDKVIENVKKIQNYKRGCNSEHPKLQWQFVLNSYNENEVLEAKQKAKELGIPIVFKLNFIRSYEPKDPERLKKETGLSEVTRKEYFEKHGVPYLNDDCLQVFYDPQFNFDGAILGCCRNEWQYFKANLFTDGLEACLQDRGFKDMKKFLLSRNPNPKKYGELPCIKCDLWKERATKNIVLDLKEKNFLKRLLYNLFK